ncbi:MAG: outer membrane lipoprotein carrier protein LolA [Bacteroidales bacterium]|nr:outer membrane lipoprotein carrier protein LolA [Bacteroidales bacterium]
MKTLKLTIFLSLLVTGLFAQDVKQQQDPEAKKILDKVSAKIKSYETIITDFEFLIEDKIQNLKSNSSGTVYIKDDKYKVVSPGSLVMYNGDNMWDYSEDINEVTISKPNKDDNDFMENPAKIFTFYERDFKFRLRGEAKVDNVWTYEIDLYPVNLNQPYSRYKVYVNKTTEMIYMIAAIGKEGVDYTATIKNSKFNTPLPDSDFSFNTSKYPGIEIVDLR